MSSCKPNNVERIKIITKACTRSKVSFIYENIMTTQEKYSIFYLYIVTIILYKRFKEVIYSNKEIVDEIFIKRNGFSQRCFSIESICEPNNEKSIIRHIINEIEILRKNILNSEELDHFKSFISEYLNNNKKYHLKGQKNHEELIHRIIKHDNGKDDDIINDEILISTITPQNLQNFIDKNFIRENLRILIIIPKNLKDAVTVQEIQKALDSSSINSSKKNCLLTPIHILDKSSLPLPGLIVRTIKKSNSITYFLSNGAKVQLNSYDSKCGSLGIDLEITSEGGYYDLQMEYPEKIASAKITSLFAKYISLGNVNLNRHSIDIGVILQDFNFLPFEREIKFTCLPSKFENLLQIVYNIFTSCDVDKWSDEVCQEEIEFFKKIIKQPNSIDSYFFNNAFKLNWNCDYHSLQTKDLKTIDLEFARKYFSQAFSNPSEFIFVFNGALNNIPNITWQIQKYIGSIPIPIRDESNLRRDLLISKAIEHFESNILFTKGIKEKVLYYGEEDKSIVQITYPIPGLNSYVELVVIDLLKEILEMHLFDKMMEHIGNIYSIKVESEHPFGVFFKGELTIKLTCNPFCVDNLVANILKSINILRNSGPSHVILCSAKKDIIKSKSYIKHIVFNENMKVFGKDISATNFDTFMDDHLMKDIITLLLPPENYTCIKLFPNSHKQKSINVLTKLSAGIVISALCSAMIPIIRYIFLK